jgi:hypothetical protein
VDVAEHRVEVDVGRGGVADLELDGLADPRLAPMAIEPLAGRSRRGRG